ncbi:unnamed protein product [Auanema sp. JU1783]|nr:unnamed protein product [Auanema sp. JU1783]
MLIHILILLFLRVNTSTAKTVNNKLIDNPKVTCGPDALTIEASSEDVFEGQIYIKNHRRTSPECFNVYSSEDNTTSPVFSLSLRSISTCGLEMQRDTRTKSLQLSVVVIVAFHPSFVTAGDRAFAVQCLFHQEDYPVSTGLNMAEKFNAIALEGSGEVPSVHLTIVPGKVPLNSTGEPVTTEVTIGQSIMLVWHLNNHSTVYGLRVLDCAAQSKNGRGMQILEDACSSDQNLISHVRYSDENNRAFADVTAFKFPDESELYFRCHIRLCIRKFEHLVINGADESDLCPSNNMCEGASMKSKRNVNLNKDSMIVVSGRMNVLEKLEKSNEPLSPIAMRQSSDPAVLDDKTCLNKTVMITSSVISVIAHSLILLGYSKACKKEGLIINHEISNKICFTLISTPFHKLCQECEKTQMSFPLKDCIVEPQLATCFTFISKLFVSDDSVQYISIPFQRKVSHLFYNYTNEKLFFNSAQRSKLTHQILTQIDINQFFEEEQALENSFPNENPNRVNIIMDESLKGKGIDYLLLENVYDDAFILHDPSEVEPYFKRMKENSLMSFLEAVEEIEDDPRKQISEIWSKVYKLQPINMIRDYFGEQIAFYFAWHGTFITLLWPAVALGLAVVGFGVAKNIKDEPMSLANCTNLSYEGSVKIVPCNLQENGQRIFTTIWRWIMRSFDNKLNAFYAAFMSIWGSLFYQIWKRNSSTLAYRWDTEDYHEVEPDRPGYVGSDMEKDLITNSPKWIPFNITILLKMFMSACIVGFFMLIVVLSVFCVTVYKLWVINNNGCNDLFTFKCSLLTTLVPSVFNTVSTMLLGWVFGKVVVRLNDWENHRTTSEHQNAMIIKIFAFQMVNSYTSLFYIAFVRPEHHGFQSNGLFGLGEEYKDSCSGSTCSMMLAVQLITNLVLKPIPKFVNDIVIPFLMLVYRKSKMKKKISEEVESQNYETNFLMREWVKPDPGQFTLWEFNEKIILFGNTMMFAALFPLAPLISLIIGLVDLRIDAHRLLWFNRRPLPSAANGIGIWLPVLFFLQYAAIMTNAFIIAFTSDFCSNFWGQGDCNLQDRFLIVIVFQNVLFVLKYLLESLIPSVPAAINVAKRKKRFIISHIIGKGDLPQKTRMRKHARKAKLAWIASHMFSRSNNL